MKSRSRWWALRSVAEHCTPPRWRVSAQVVKVCAHNALGRAFEPLDATDRVDGLRLRARCLASLRVDPQALPVGRLHGELQFCVLGSEEDIIPAHLPRTNETDERMRRKRFSGARLRASTYTRPAFSAMSAMTRLAMMSERDTTLLLDELKPASHRSLSGGCGEAKCSLKICVGSAGRFRELSTASVRDKPQRGQHDVGRGPLEG